MTPVQGELVSATERLKGMGYVPSEWDHTYLEEFELDRSLLVPGWHEFLPEAEASGLSAWHWDRDPGPTWTVLLGAAHGQTLESLQPFRVGLVEPHLFSS